MLGGGLGGGFGGGGVVSFGSSIRSFSSVFVRSFVFVRLRTVSFVGGGAWFRSVRRFVRFRAFLLRFRLITAGFVRLMFQSRSRGHGSQPRNSFVFVVHFVASFVWGNRF